MDAPIDLESIKPDHVFDGGDLDCGSGLVLLIRENMRRVPQGGIFEMRSKEPTVKGDLPPWCRMVGLEYLGYLDVAGFTRYFIRKTANAIADETNLEKDKVRAKEYEWRARARSTGILKSTVYCRNFSIEVGQPASFETSDKHPSAVEYLLAALVGDLTTGFATECGKGNVQVDDIEMTVSGKLNNILAHLGLEEGDPSFASIEMKLFVSSSDDEAKVREAWDRTIQRSPLTATLKKAVHLKFKFSIL
ncbi:MAG TPA: OsmC family protein [Acidobacteriota bacterium]|nr:OsmC family protein [Acidobacteriota bacterium]